VKVHHILFILWGIVFAFWLVKQFAESNKRNEDR
jgi:positive regulator of sigma E activity